MKNLIVKFKALSLVKKIIVVIVGCVAISGSGFGIMKIMEPSYDDYIQDAEKVMSSDKNKAEELLMKAIDKDNTKDTAYVDLVKLYVDNNEGSKALNIIKMAKKQLADDKFTNIQSHEKDAYYSVYRKYVSDYEKKYQAIHCVEKENSLALSGVFYIALTDYNNDGIDELTLFYRDEKTSEIYYSVKVFTYDAKAFQCKEIFKMASRTFEDYHMAIVNNSTVHYLLLDNGETSGQYTYDGNKFTSTDKNDNVFKLESFTTYYNSFKGYPTAIATYGGSGSESSFDLFDVVKDAKETLGIKVDETKETTDSKTAESSKTSSVDYSLYLSVINQADEELYDPPNYSNMDENYDFDEPYDRGTHIFYDMDRDGVKELGIDYGSDFYTDKFVFYTIKDNKVIKLGESETQHVGLFTEDSNGKIVLAASQAGPYRFRLDVIDGKIEEVDEFTSPDYLFNGLTKLQTYSLDEIESQIK